MIHSTNKGSTQVITVVIVVLAVIALVMANRWLQQETGEIVSQAIEAPQKEKEETPPPVKEEKPKVKRFGEVIRKARLSPSCER